MDNANASNARPKLVQLVAVAFGFDDAPLTDPGDSVRAEYSDGSYIRIARSDNGHLSLIAPEGGWLELAPDPHARTPESYVVHLIHNANALELQAAFCEREGYPLLMPARCSCGHDVATDSNLIPLAGNQWLTKCPACWRSFT